MMNGSKPCGPSGGRRGLSPQRRPPRLRVSCSLSAQPSPPYVCSMVGTSRCDVRAACSGATLRMAVSLEYSFRPLLRGRGRHSAPSLPPLNTLSPPEGETFARALIIRPSLVFVRLRNDGQRSGDCNHNIRIIQRRSNALPLLGERVGVRGNEANSNPRRTTTPGTVKLRESPGRAGGFSI
jgi:hypothetical protein